MINLPEDFSFRSSKSVLKVEKKAKDTKDRNSNEPRNSEEEITNVNELDDENGNVEATS